MVKLKNAMTMLIEKKKYLYTYFVYSQSKLLTCSFSDYRSEQNQTVETLVKQDQISIMGGTFGNSYKSRSLTREAKHKMARNILA